MLLVQELISSWGKDLRSAGELRRNVPLALPFPKRLDAGPSDSLIAHHTVHYLGTDQFAASRARVEFLQLGNPILFQSGGLQVRLHADKPGCTAIKFKWSADVGAPERPDRHLGNLEDGQWMQFMYNGRTAISGSLRTEWRYMQWTVNVAVALKPDERIFVSTEPMIRINELVDLR